jgi:Kef-type K+ transport system membrane component KefB/nucleotide-binding universal stress UspA family protein
MDLVPPSDHQVLVFLVAFLVLLATARALGALAQRIGQPEVVGQLGAGLVLGPSVLGRVAPGVEGWLFPGDGVPTAMLFTVAWLGVIFLLLATGFETDLGLIRRLGRAAAVVSGGSLLVPIAAGLAVGVAMPSIFVGEGDRTQFALFMGAALSISSLPVIAKILTDMGYMRRNFGQMTLAAGMANDVVGWIALGIIAGLVSSDSLSASGVAVTVAGIAGFFLVAFTLGQRLVDAALRRMRRSEADSSSQTTVLVAITLIGAVSTQWLGVEAVLGAFVVGIVVGRSPYRDAGVLHGVENASTAFLAPVFFATAGLRVDLGLLADGTVARWGLVVIAVASISKFVGAVAGGVVARLPGRESAALGVALNARGALEIVIAAVGLSLGVLNLASYTVVVLMAMATSIMAPPLLRAVLRGWPGTAEEQDRLRREETLSADVVVRGDRVLLASLDPSTAVLAAQVVELAWPKETPVTVLMPEVSANGHLDAALAVFDEREVGTELSAAGGLVEAVVAEAKLGYGAIVLGIPDRIASGPLPEAAGELLAQTQVPVVLVRRPRRQYRRTPWAFARALVPVAGSRAARAAQEIAFGISSSIGTETVLAHITDSTAAAQRSGRAVAGDVLAHGSEVGANVGARVQTIERRATAPADEIVSLARDVGADLVVVGGTRRTAADTQFLGQTTTQILLRCDATVVAVIPPQPPPSPGCPAGSGRLGPPHAPSCPQPLGAGSGQTGAIWPSRTRRTSSG